MNSATTCIMSATKSLSQFRQIFNCLMKTGITPEQATALETLRQSSAFQGVPNNQEDIFADGSLREYITQNLEDPWENTSFEGYVYISPKQKGEFGERFFEKLFVAKGYEVKRAPTATDSYDRLIGDLKVEMRFSLATRDKKGKGI